MQKYLPTNDLLFKKCFTSEDSLHILKAFVKDLLGIEFKQLKPKETYHIDSYKKTFDKLDITRTEVDILAIGEDGSHTTIECQIQPHMYFRERTIFYLAEAFCSPFGNLETANFIKGNNFSALRPAYGINIIDFHLFDKKQPALQRFRLLNEESSVPFLGTTGKELLIACFLSFKKRNNRTTKRCLSLAILFQKWYSPRYRPRLHQRSETKNRLLQTWKGGKRDDYENR